MGRSARAALQLTVGLGLLAYVVAANWSGTADRPGLGDLLREPLHVWPLAGAVALYAAAVALNTVRWVVLVRALSISTPVLELIRLGLIGQFFNTLLPGGVGGDVVKAAALARSQSQRSAAVASVLFDRVIGLWGLVALVAVAGLACGYPPELAVIVYAAWAVVPASIGVWWLIGVVSPERVEVSAVRMAKIPLVGRPVAGLWRAGHVYRRATPAVLVAIGLALATHVVFVGSFDLAVRSFGSADGLPTVAEHFVIVPPGMAIKALFPAPGGVGGGEYGFGRLYAMTGRPAARGVAGSLVLLGVGFSIGAAGGIVYLVTERTAKMGDAGSTA